MGLGGVKNFSVGICDDAPSTARSSLYLQDSYITKFDFMNFCYLKWMGKKILTILHSKFCLSSACVNKWRKCDKEATFLRTKIISRIRVLIYLGFLQVFHFSRPLVNFNAQLIFDYFSSKLILYQPTNH